MLKKIIIAGSIFLISLSNAYAGFIGPLGVYAVGGINYLSIKSEDDTTIFQGVDGKVGLGVGDLRFDYFFLAAEGFYQPLKPLSIQNKYGPGGDGNNSLRPKNSFGVDVLGGLYLDDYVKFFGKLGALRTEFDIVGATKNAWQVGAGIEWNFIGPWAGRLEYIRSYYGTIKTIGGVHQDEGVASIVYHFGWGDAC